MSETEEDRAWYEAVEAAFIRRRGTPFLLSPSDFALLRQWRVLGVPLEAVEIGIDDAFGRREERKAVGRVNSLSYCRDAVLEAWERRAETSRGKGSPSGGPEPDAQAALANLAERLDAARTRRPDLSAPLDSALRSLSRLEASGKTSRTSRRPSPAWTGVWPGSWPRPCPRVSAPTWTPRSRACSPAPAPGWIRRRSRKRPGR